MFENITKNVIAKDSAVVNADYNGSKGNIEIVAQCYCGFDVERTSKEAIANAEFIAFCFNLQQKYDIGLFEEAIDLFHTLIYSETVNDFYCDKINNLLNSINQNK